ncbi:MAG: AMP-binding protein [Sulfolobales archaeon]
MQPNLPGQYIQAKDILEEAERIYSSRTAIIDYVSGYKYSYSDLGGRSSKIAGFLQDLSLKPGDRIAYMLTNRIECIDLFKVSGMLGLILVPLNWRLLGSELRSIIRNTAPKVIFYESVFRDLAAEALKGINGIFRVVIDGEPREGEYSYEEALKAGGIKTPRKVSLEEPRMILYTGGTTGIPKGAVISNRQILFNIFSEILTWRLREDHRTVALLPLFHTGGWNLLTLPLLARGGMIYMIRRFDPKLFLEIIETEKGPFTIFGVPTMYYMISKHGDFREASFRNVEWMMSGGSHIDRKILEEFWAKGVKMAQGYGSTEAGPNNLTPPIQDLSLDDMKTRWRSVGKPFAFNEVFVVDDNGNILGPNQYGELVFCGPLVFSGYWGMPEETKLVLRDGCVYTGDIGFYDDEGYFYVVDRKKDIIKSGGEQVYPREIEELVLQHPAVEDCAVIPVPDEKWGEVPKLVVKLRSGLGITKHEILGFLEGKIARYKIPKYVAVVDEIPRNPAGKILKRVLIEKHGSPIDEI